MAMRRISWIDQRIRTVWSEGVAAFFSRSGVGAMTDAGHHGEGEHDERHMAVPAMAGAGFVVIEAEFVLGGFEAVVSRPEGLHLRPLAELCVRLSPHTAPIRRTRQQYLSANVRRDAGSSLRWSQGRCLPVFGDQQGVCTSA